LKEGTNMNKELRAITKSEAEYLRKDVAGVDICHSPRGTEYGVVEVVIGTGRATCRVCGCKIIKGERAVKFEWDFTGNGSWTLTTCQIHETECCPAETYKPFFYSHPLLKGENSI
jgi:hypothetical protein